MTDKAKEGEARYAALNGLADRRFQELSRLLGPYIDVTDEYGRLICRLTLVLGSTPPKCGQDEVIRDLMADVFDFLLEARTLVLKGKREVAVPLARRAYESLSLMVACHQNAKLAAKWAAGKKISNREVRKLLAAHPFGEPEVRTKELYGSFSKAAHPNRDLVAHRFLGEGNEFVLGSSGETDLVLLADYCGTTLNLWFWYVAFIGFIYAEVLVKHDKTFTADYLKTAQTAKEVNRWLHKQYERVLADYPVELEEYGKSRLRNSHL